ncbi:MAG: hypothetical protein HYR91_02020 [Flavobacteriia bacterium]|nr:hypothetical protein [Flavobacteriia bacterium]
MKGFILIAIFITTLFSCTSEYTERMEKALELKKEFILVMKNEDIQNKESISKDLKSQIQVQAKLSGNESLFYRQLALNK